MVDNSKTTSQNSMNLYQEKLKYIYILVKISYWLQIGNFSDFSNEHKKKSIFIASSQK